MMANYIKKSSTRPRLCDIIKKYKDIKGALAMNKKAVVGYLLLAIAVAAVCIYFASIPKNTGSGKKNSLELTISQDRTCYSVTSIGTYEDANVIIPAEYSGLPVTAIENNAFKGCDFITSVEIPDSVTKIGKNAFMDCSRLTDVAIPASIKEIDESAFSGCVSLKSVTLSDGIETIGGYAFSRCTSLEGVVIPDSVTDLGGSAFNECSALVKAKLSNNLKTIGSNLFMRCSSLKDIEIPDGVTEIGQGAFSYCGITDIVIPDSVTVIGQEAFSYSEELTNIRLPKNLETINMETFISCTSLESVDIPDGVTQIGWHAFYCCYSLSSVTIPDSVTEICAFAFGACSSLKSVNIPYGVRIIGDAAFNQCMTEELIIPESVESVGYEAFMTGTFSSVVIPKNVKEINGSPFTYCKNLTDLRVDEENEVYYSASNCIIEKESGTLIAACPASIIPNDGSIKVIGPMSLCGDYETLTIPDGVKEIQDRAAVNCRKLKEITLPKSLETIGVSVFQSDDIERVIYMGSEEEWNEIEKADQWIGDSADFEIVFAG